MAGVCCFTTLSSVISSVLDLCELHASPTLAVLPASAMTMRCPAGVFWIVSICPCLASGSRCLLSRMPSGSKDTLSTVIVHARFTSRTCTCHALRLAEDRSVVLSATFRNLRPCARHCSCMDLLDVGHCSCTTVCRASPRHELRLRNLVSFRDVRHLSLSHNVYELNSLRGLLDVCTSVVSTAFWFSPVLGTCQCRRRLYRWSIHHSDELPEPESEASPLLPELVRMITVTSTSYSVNWTSCAASEQQCHRPS